MTLAILDDITPGDLTGGMRVAVTGTDKGPPLFDALELVGKDKTLARIEHGRSLLNGGGAR